MPTPEEVVALETTDDPMVAVEVYAPVFETIEVWDGPPGPPGTPANVKVVEHGADPYAERPAVPFVIWRGESTPYNRAPQDFWVPAPPS